MTEGEAIYAEHAHDLEHLHAKDVIKDALHFMSAKNPADEELGEEAPGPETWGGTSADAPAPPG